MSAAPAAAPAAAAAAAGVYATSSVGGKRVYGGGDAATDDSDEDEDESQQKPRRPSPKRMRSGEHGPVSSPAASPILPPTAPSSPVVPPLDAESALEASLPELERAWLSRDKNAVYAAVGTLLELLHGKRLYDSCVPGTAADATAPPGV